MSAVKLKIARHFRAHWLFYLLVVAGIFIDLGSKALAFGLIPHRVVYVENPRTPVGKIYTEYRSGLHPIALDAGGEIRPPKRVVIPSFFAFQLSFNPGAMFGILPNVGFLIAFTVVALAVIIYVLTRLQGAQRFYQVGLALIAAGAVANLWDRIFHHAVRDFLDFSIEFWPWLAGKLVSWRGHPAGAHWPTFNFADIFILAGVIMIFIKQFFSKKPEPENGNV